MDEEIENPTTKKDSKEKVTEDLLNDVSGKVYRKSLRPINTPVLSETERKLRTYLIHLVHIIKNNLGGSLDEDEVQGILEELGKTAHTLHISLKENGYEPCHKDYMIKNRGVDPENPLFYKNVHSVEALLNYIDRPFIFNANYRKSTKYPASRKPSTLFGIITFLDILGWKGIYSRKPNAISILAHLIKDIKFQQRQYRGQINDITEIISISDTIVICTFCFAYEVPTAIDIHGALCQWIIPKSINEGIPVRGVISYGEIDRHENIFIGKAVDDAANWYEQADWIGVHVTPSTEFNIDINNSTKWVRFSPPCKTPMKMKVSCVNWTEDWENGQNELTVIKKKFGELGPISPSIVGKFANTLNFIKKAQNLLDE